MEFSAKLSGIFWYIYSFYKSSTYVHNYLNKYIKKLLDIWDISNILVKKIKRINFDLNFLWKRCQNDFHWWSYYGLICRSSWKIWIIGCCFTKRQFRKIYFHALEMFFNQYISLVWNFFFWSYMLNRTIFLEIRHDILNEHVEVWSLGYWLLKARLIKDKCYFYSIKDKFHNIFTKNTRCIISYFIFNKIGF